ncbi:hypothetical protein Tco_0225946 [Tanacetum coccineum]
MNPQETLQVAARDEKWVPSPERVKISSTNIRLETTMSLKSLCSNSGTPSRRFKNKKCTVNAEVFRTILNICLRVEGEDFADVPDGDTALTFLIDLGYKGPLNWHTNMFVDHMHQPWRTLAAIINKCFSGEIASNDKLKKSKIDILWGMFNRENVDYPELIWEDFAYQIDHRKEKRPRRENMPYPRFTKIIINHFLKQHKSLTNFNHKHYHTIKDDRIASRLKFVRIESYQMFIKYSTNQIPPKKSRGKGSKGKKTAEESQETINVYEESGPEPKPAKKKTASRRVVKKKVTMSADDNIISDDPDAALELAKSISQTEVEEAEAARKVHATHARIVTESVPEFAKKKSGGRSDPSLTLAEQEAANIMQALKETVSATSSEGTGAKPRVLDNDKDITKEKVILNWGDKQDSEHFDDDNDDVKKDNKDDDADDEAIIHVSDTQDVDDEDDETESDEDEIYKYKIHVRKDEDVEMKDAEVEEYDKGEEKVTDASKEEAKKTSEAKDDAKKTKLPPSSSSLSVSSGFGDQYLKISSDSSLVSTVKDSADTDKVPVSVILETTNLLPILEIVTETPVSTTVPSPQVTPIISTVPQTPTPIPTPPIITDALTVTTAVPESNALTAVELRVAKLEKDVFELKTIDHSSEALAVLQSQVLTVVDSYLDTKVGDIKKEQAEKQKKPQFTIKSTNKVALKEYDLKSALYQSMHANKSFNRNPANHQLYHALIEALIEDENAMDKGVADTVKDHKRKHDDHEDDDDEDPPAGPNQGKKTKRRRTKDYESSKKPSTTKETPNGKAPTKGSKTSKSPSAKEPVEEPIAEVVMDDAGDDVARDDYQPQDTSEPKTRKTLNPDWFMQPLRPPTHDPEWNKRRVVLDQPAQPWFNQMVFASNYPLTFNDLMATPIDFSKYVLNGLKIDNLTQDIMLGPAFNLLKGTCSSSIELEYNFQECFNALTEKLDWNNPEGERYPFDLSKPLPLQGPSGHRTVAADYFFNNDLEYLKTFDPEVTYTTSITKTKAARYEIKGIEDMVLTLWSTIKHAYDRDAKKGIKHWGERRKLWYL